MRLLNREIITTPIEDKAAARIVDVEMVYEKTKSFAITFELLNGQNAGILIRDDKFHATEQGKYFWKFKQLMKALGKYKVSEDIELEKTFLNKNLYVFLTIFRTENRFGKELQFQNVLYAGCPYTDNQIAGFIQDVEEKLKIETMNQIHNMVNTIKEQSSDSPFIDLGNSIPVPRKV